MSKVSVPPAPLDRLSDGRDILSQAQKAREVTAQAALANDLGVSDTLVIGDRTFRDGGHWVRQVTLVDSGSYSGPFAQGKISLQLKNFRSHGLLDKPATDLRYDKTGCIVQDTTTPDAVANIEFIRQRSGNGFETIRHVVQCEGQNRSERTTVVRGDGRITKDSLTPDFKEWPAVRCPVDLQCVATSKEALAAAKTKLDIELIPYPPQAVPDTTFVPYDPLGESSAREQQGLTDAPEVVAEYKAVSEYAASHVTSGGQVQPTVVSLEKGITGKVRHSLVLTGGTVEAGSSPSGMVGDYQLAENDFSRFGAVNGRIHTELSQTREDGRAYITKVVYQITARSSDQTVLKVDKETGKVVGNPSYTQFTPPWPADMYRAYHHLTQSPPST